MSRKLKLQLFAGILVTGVIIYFSVVVIRKLDLEVVFRSDINWFLVIVSIIIYIYSNYIRGLAYTRGIDPEMDRMTALQVVGIGHALNMVLPLHAGEGLRFAFFPSHYTVKRRAKLLVITILSDFIVVVMVTVATIPFAGFKDKALLTAAWIMFYGCIGLLAAAIALIFIVPRFRRYVGEYLNKSMLKMFVWVALSWIIMIAAIWLGLVAFGFPLLISIKMALAVFVATNIINLIPASPGAIGLYEYGTVLALAGFGVDNSTALSASLLLHVIQYGALLPLGAFLYIKALHGKYGDAIRGMWKKKPPSVEEALVTSTCDTDQPAQEPEDNAE